VTVPLTLYTRSVCPLCDDLVAALGGLPLDLTQVDVGGDPDLEARYGMRIPVLVDADGNLLAEGRIDGDGLGRVRRLVEEKHT
jgi:glutathione S-transferase